MMDSLFKEHYNFHYAAKQIEKAGNKADALDLFVGSKLGFRTGEGVLLPLSDISNQIQSAAC